MQQASVLCIQDSLPVSLEQQTSNFEKKADKNS